MRDIGQKLKEAREERGLSLKAISEQTKIRIRYLQAIENGDFDVIPGKVYAKGFLKAYALIVGLDPIEIITQYQGYLDQLKKEEIPEDTEITIISNRSPFMLRRILIIFFVLALLGGGFIFVKKIWTTIKTETIPLLVSESEPKVEEPSTVMESESNTETFNNNQLHNTSVVNEDAEDENVEAAEIENVENTEVDNVKEVEDDAIELGNENLNLPNAGQDTSVNQSSKVIQSTDVEKIQIQIIANDTSWIRISVDGEINFQGQIFDGETRLVEGTKINLRISNAAAIQVNYNGIIVGPFGEKDEFVERVFGE